MSLYALANLCAKAAEEAASGGVHGQSAAWGTSDEWRARESACRDAMRELRASNAAYARLREPLLYWVGTTDPELLGMFLKDLLEVQRTATESATLEPKS